MLCCLLIVVCLFLHSYLLPRFPTYIRNSYCISNSYGNSYSKSYRKELVESNCKQRRQQNLLVSPAEIKDDELFRHLRNEFLTLSKGGSSINFKTFFRWNEVQALLGDELITSAELQELWNKNCLKKMETSEEYLDYDQFVAINAALDDLFEDEEEEEEDENGDGEEGVLIDVDDVTVDDIWDPDFSIEDLFENDYLSYLVTVFNENKNSDGQFTYESFMAWDDMIQELNEGNIDTSCMKEVWKEALLYRKNRFNTDSGSSTGLKNSYVDMDTFLRMNYRLEVAVADLQNAVDSLTSEEMEQYYRDEFSRLGDGEELITLQQLLAWEDLQDLVDKKKVTVEKLKQLWNILPKKPLSIITNDKSDSGGINVNAFIALNNALLESLAGDE